MTFTPQQLPSGGVLQSGVSYGGTPGGQQGLLLRGVVLTTWVYDDPNHPYAGYSPASIYSDVLIYSVIPGGRTYVVPRCLVLQPNAGVAKGQVVKPRAAKGMTDGGPLDLARPLALDGDNVLVGFIDNQRTQPVILGFVPHPSADRGTIGQGAGHRVRMSLLDGDPSLVKHHGCVYGVTDNGDILLDASQGNAGVLAAGAEVPAVPASAGSISMILDSKGARITKLVSGPQQAQVPQVTESLSLLGYTLTFAAGIPGFSIVGPTGPVFGIVPPAVPGGKVKGAVGDAGSDDAEGVAIGQVVLDFFKTLKTYLDTHTHTSAAPGAITTPPTSAPGTPMPSPTPPENIVSSTFVVQG